MKNFRNILVGIFAIAFTLVAIPQLTSAKVVTVKKIDNISVTAKLGEKYNLPATVKALMSNNKTQNIAVKWNVNTVNTNTAGTFKYNGTVNGYSKKVILSIKVLEAKKDIATESPAPTAGNKNADTAKPSQSPSPSPKSTPAPDGVSSATTEAN
jgi:hypothetical protein